MSDVQPLPLVYLDSMVFVHLIEGDDKTRPPARQLFEKLRTRPGAAVTSELALAEVLAPATWNSGQDEAGVAKPLPFHIKRDLYLNLIVSGGFLALIPVTRDILIETADLRLKQPQKLPDAIHVVSAARSQCRFLMTADRRVRLPDKMIKVTPDVEGVARVTAALA